MTREESKPNDWDWVEARKRCSMAVVFESLHGQAEAERRSHDED